MLNKLSYNIMNELNEADTNAIEIKKKVFIESDKVTVKNKVEEAAPVSTNQQIIDAKKDSIDKGLYTEERKDKEERLASLKTQLEKDKDQLAADEIEAIEKEIADLEAELFEKEKLNETGEWDDNDDEMKIWKEELRDKAEYIANEIHGSVASVSGFDKYQGPVAIISTPIHGDVQLWFDNEDDTGLSLLCKIAHVGWIQGSANYISDILSREVIPEDEIINESENLLKESKVIWSDQIDTSEETYNAEWQDAGYSSAEEAIADGFPDYDTWIEGDKYAESEILLDDLKNNILPQIENQANLDYIFLTGNYNSNYPDFRPSGSGGVTLKGIDELNNYLAKWDSVTIFEEDGNIGVKCADHDGSVELMLYTFATDNEEELAKMLGYTEDNFDEFENDLYYKSIDTNIINDHPEAIKPIADTITSFNESEEVKGKEVLNELGTDSTIDKLIAGDELYFRNNDGLALMVRYADTYDQPEDYDEGYTQGWERGADEEFDKVQDENFAKAKQAAEEGNVWEVLEIDETTLQPNGSVYGYLYGQEELAKFLKEVREVRVVKRLEESKKICEKCGKEVCECDKSINESGEDIKKDLNIEAGSDEEAELDNILDTNYNDLFDNLDDEEKEEYNKIAATIRDLKPEEALIDVIDEIESKAKENGLEKDLLIFAYLNKGKMNEAAPINSDLKKGKEDRLASLKTQLEADGDQLSDDEKKAIEDEIAQLEKEVYTESSIKTKSIEKEHRIMDGNKVIKKFKDNEFEKGYNEMRDMGKKLKADGKEDNLIYKTVTIKNINETGEWDNNDEDMQMWLEDLRDQAKELAAEVKGEVKSVTGFDAYQGPRAIVHTPKHGDIEMWYDLEDDRGLTFNCKVAHVGWINGGINQLAEILNQDTIDDNEIISESESTINEAESLMEFTNGFNFDAFADYMEKEITKIYPSAKFKRNYSNGHYLAVYLGNNDTSRFIIEAFINTNDDGSLNDGAIQVTYPYTLHYSSEDLNTISNNWTGNSNSAHFKIDEINKALEMIKFICDKFQKTDLDENKKLKENEMTDNRKPTKIEEAEVSNLKTIKSQGNIFMLEDDNQYIVGENYNEPENIIENAEIYSTKEEADKDYFNRCGITLEESVEEKDLSKDLFGSEAEKRQSEANRALEKYLDLAREIKAGNNDTITLDSAKQLLKNAYIKAKGYYSFEPEEIDRRIAKDIPDLFGDLEEGVISDLKATHLAKKAAKLSKEKDFGKSTKAFAKSMEINDKSANKLDNKAKKLEDKAGKLRNEAIVKRNKSVKDFTSKK